MRDPDLMAQPEPARDRRAAGLNALGDTKAELAGGAATAGAVVAVIPSSALRQGFS